MWFWVGVNCCLLEGVFKIEERIATGKYTREVINKYEFFFKKKFGQNFLIDGHVINKIISASDIGKDDLVIEVGPGIGSLTQEIAERAGKVIAVEIDSNLIPILKEDTLKDYDNIEYINEDILKVNINEVIKNSGYHSVKVVANLPYYITTPIIMNLLENKVNVKSITVMIQKEVAYRMSANPSTKDYGSLTLAVQYFSEPYLVANVPQNCFMPRPNVDSAVIRLNVRETPKVDVADERKFFSLIKVAFSQRRKTLLNCIYNSEVFNYSKEEIEAILVKAGFDPRVRGESLTIEEFARLANELVQE